MARPLIADGKSCGDCGLCCKLMGVRSIDKTQYVWCSQFKRGLGCKIYEDRPHECAEFICYWLHAPNLGEDWRPDRAGFLMHLSEDGSRLNVEVDSATPNAWKQEPYASQFQAWAARGEAGGLSLQVWVGRRGYAMTANGPVDQGLLRPASPKRAKKR